MVREDLIWRITGLRDRPHCVITPDNKFLIGSIRSVRGLKVWNLISGREEAKFGSGSLKGISPTGRYVVTTSDERKRVIQ